MRILCFSDIHGNIYALRAFLRILPQIKYDQAFFLGDVFGYYYHQQEVVKAFSDIPRLKCLKGNHDEMALAVASGRLDADDLTSKYGNCYLSLSATALKEVKVLNPYEEFEADGLRIGMFHGLPGNVLEGRLYPRDPDPVDISAYEKYDVVFTGHTHFRMVRTIGRTLVVNAGSLGQPRDGLPACCMCFDTREKTVEYVDVAYSKDDLLEDVRTFDPGNGKLVELITRSGQ